MYEDYMQNYFGLPQGVQYPNIQGEQFEGHQYLNMGNPNMYGVGNYRFGPFGEQNRGISYENIEDCYPDVYNIVYPMVRKACERINGNATKEMIDNIVQNIYSNIETNERIELNINIGNDVKVEETEKADINEVEKENRVVHRNNWLMDIIKILTIQELLKRRNCKGLRM